MSEEIIKIDRYDAVIEKGKIVYYAIKGKTKYRMPDCYKEMYNEDHLAIMSRHMEMPDLFGTTAEHYIPLSTSQPIINRPTPVGVRRK